MKITADTNVLAHAILQDDAAQCRKARDLLKDATLIAVSLPSLCEFVWILRQGGKLAKEDVSVAIQALLDAGNVVMNRPAVEAGLALLEAGGDFADAIMAHVGKWLGGETFVSFDKKAVALLSKQGEATRAADLMRLSPAAHPFVGPLAMSDDGLGLQLVPWSPGLEKKLGQHVSGAVRDDGGIEWAIGRKLGLGL